MRRKTKHNKLHKRPIVGGWERGKDLTRQSQSASRDIRADNASVNALARHRMVHLTTMSKDRLSKFPLTVTSIFYARIVRLRSSNDRTRQWAILFYSQFIIIYITIICQLYKCTAQVFSRIFVSQIWIKFYYIFRKTFNAAWIETEFCCLSQCNIF